MRQIRPELNQTNVESLLTQIRNLEQRLAEANRALKRQSEEFQLLISQNELLESLFQQAPVMVVIYDSDLEKFRVNQAFGSILGYNNEDLSQPGFDLMEHVYPDPDYRLYASEFMLSTREGWLDLSVTAKDGSQVDSSWSNIRLIDGTQIGIGIDTRDRKLAEQALRESNERFRLALSSTTVTVFTMDRRLRYTWIYNSPDASKRNPSIYIGKRDDELTRVVNLEEMVAFKQSVLDSGQGARRELTLWANGEKRIFDLALEPLRNSSGEVIGLTGASIELTDQRRAVKEALQNQLQMEVQRRLIEHREQERIQIARDLHDGPLQEMIGIYFTIKESISAMQRDQTPNHMVLLEGSLQRQISNLRAFCTELRPPSLGPFGLEKVILSHVESFRLRHPEITFYVLLQNDREVLDETTRMALFRVYQEALNNVVRHACANQVWIELAIENDHIRLEIRDDGNGFDVPEEWIEYARKGHFGLVGMQERISSVGGTLQLYSAPGQGVCLTATVPLTRGPATF